MGTGSHRPQWEAAKGRPDELGGIKHARALRSHTRLKYRPKRELAVRKEIESQQNQLSEFNSDRAISRAIDVSDLNKKITGETSSKEPSDEKLSSKRITSEERISSKKKKMSSSPIIRADSEQDSCKSDSESDSESMAEELSRLKENQQQKQKRVPSWRSESAFSRTATRSDNEDAFLSRYIR